MPRDLHPRLMRECLVRLPRRRRLPWWIGHVVVYAYGVLLGALSFVTLLVALRLLLLGVALLMS